MKKVFAEHVEHVTALIVWLQNEDGQDRIQTPQWSNVRYIFLFRATATKHIVLKHTLPNKDYRKCPRWPI